MSESSGSFLRGALGRADETKALVLGTGVLTQVGALFRAQFGDAAALVVADETTFGVAGRAVLGLLRREGLACDEPLVFSEPGFFAEYRHVDRIEAVLHGTRAIPMVVGSGTLNDLTKRAAHGLGRPYMVVATAASMDGYTAFGASITHQGSKQTFPCAAPRAVLADMAIIAKAPPAMTASGYADLFAKVTCGADWLLADAFGEEAIEPVAWEMIQGRLRTWLGAPEGIPHGDPVAVENLMEGLLLGGFAMQHTKSSRCASGAEHQFSHLWDMEHHTHEGAAPAHGFKVGVATLAVARLYESLLRMPLEDLDIEAAVARWPVWEEQERAIRGLYEIEEIRQKAVEESRAKYVAAAGLRAHLERTREAWPALRGRLAHQLPPVTRMEEMLAAAGAPVQPEAIGISLERLRESFRRAQPIRRRYTVLDYAVRSGQLERALD